MNDNTFLIIGVDYEDRTPLCTDNTLELALDLIQNPDKFDERGKGDPWDSPPHSFGEWQVYHLVLETGRLRCVANVTKHVGKYHIEVYCFMCGGRVVAVRTTHHGGTVHEHDRIAVECQSCKANTTAETGYTYHPGQGIMTWKTYIMLAGQALEVLSTLEMDHE